MTLAVESRQILFRHTQRVGSRSDLAGELKRCTQHVAPLLVVLHAHRGCTFAARTSTPHARRRAATSSAIVSASAASRSWRHIGDGPSSSTATIHSVPSSPRSSSRAASHAPATSATTASSDRASPSVDTLSLSHLTGENGRNSTTGCAGSPRSTSRPPLAPVSRGSSALQAAAVVDMRIAGQLLAEVDVPQRPVVEPRRAQVVERRCRVRAVSAGGAR